MSSKHEVLGGLHDYEWQAKEKLRPKTADEPRLLGRFARLLFEETSIEKMKTGFANVVAWWKKERAEEKAYHAHSGSLAEIQHKIVPLEEEYHMPEAAAPDPNYMQPLKSHRYGELKAYRSVHAGQTAEGPGSIDDEMAEVMQTAVDNARKHLGELSVDATINDTDNSDEDDAALLERLEAAYAQPAVSPHQRNAGRHRATRKQRNFRLPIIRHSNDNDLTSTTGK